MSDHDTHWSAKAAWMRNVGATDAAWSTEGDLVHLRLGPLPVPTDDSRDRETQPSISPQERERRARLERRDLVARSSGGPVRRLDAED